MINPVKLIEPIKPIMPIMPAMLAFNPPLSLASGIEDEGTALHRMKLRTSGHETRNKRRNIIGKLL